MKNGKTAQGNHKAYPLNHFSHVFIRSSEWFMLFASAVIGQLQSNYYGFVFMTIDWKLLYKSQMNSL